ncbi:MAG: hypothetical protein JST00_41335 [Deltaproteobacteria bacterium]|nr:hypothetical protein [Deltaproteobacteria bacterium]
MCCFSRPVRFVGGTRIFARAIEGDGGEPRQILAYAMNVEIDEEVAMVLPLPVPPRPSDDAVTFLDLEGYDRFFLDLEDAFPPDYATMPQAKGGFRGFGAPEKPRLVVHDVGRFEASFVPHRDDFARLDPRFRMPERVWDRMPAYADWGFAVFRLAPKKRGLLSFGASRERIHPMAFSFPRRDEKSLFFPTLHVHDGGSVPERAAFDHMLFCQADGVLEATLPWTASPKALGANVDGARSRGVIDPARGGMRQSLGGEAPNEDVVLSPPPGIVVSDLQGRGESYAYRVRAESAYMGEPHDEMRRAWKRTARTKLPVLCRTLREGLAALVASRRERWGLTTLDEGLPPHFLNGFQLWTGTDYTNGTVAKPGGPGRIAFRIFTKRVELQDITLAFARLPDQAAVDAIRGELEALVDRAAD